MNVRAKNKEKWDEGDRICVFSHFFSAPRTHIHSHARSLNLPA